MICTEVRIFSRDLFANTELIAMNKWWFPSDNIWLIMPIVPGLLSQWHVYTVTRVAKIHMPWRSWFSLIRLHQESSGIFLLCQISYTPFLAHLNTFCPLIQVMNHIRSYQARSGNLDFCDIGNQRPGQSCWLKVNDWTPHILREDFNIIFTHTIDLSLSMHTRGNFQDLGRVCTETEMRIKTLSAIFHLIQSEL